MNLDWASYFSCLRDLELGGGRGVAASTYLQGVFSCLKLALLKADQGGRLVIKTMPCGSDCHVPEEQGWQKGPSFQVDLMYPGSDVRDLYAEPVAGGSLLEIWSFVSSSQNRLQIFVPDGQYVPGDRVLVAELDDNKKQLTGEDHRCLAQYVGDHVRYAAGSRTGFDPSHRWGPQHYGFNF